MNKKQKRLQLIQYFLNISKAQEEIQTIQNELISHIRFNPAYLYKKIAQNQSIMSRSQLKSYIENVTTIKDKQIIKKYLQKHSFESNISLDSFTLSLLPYTPNVLRQVTQKIKKQMETKYLDALVEQLYQKMLQAELRSIYEFCLTQKQLQLNWDAIKQLIEKDLIKNGKKIDTLAKQYYSIINIRKWLELWINIDEYKILNIMRWFGGFKEQHMTIMQDLSKISVFCTCKGYSILNINSYQANSKDRENSSSRNKSPRKLKKIKSETVFVGGVDYYLRKFAKYVEIIIKSKRKIQSLKNNLAPYRRDVQLIMHSILSKKHSYTKMVKIIGQIEIALKLKPETVQKMRDELQMCKIDNNRLFQLFETKLNIVSLQSKVSKENIIILVYEVLYNFCMRKATLKSLSNQINQGVALIFKQIDHENNKSAQKKDLKLMLNQLNIKHKQEELILLMSYFGDGEIITPQSIQRAIKSESQI